MVNVAYVTEEIIRQKPFLQEALASGIINYAALAESLQPEVKKILRKDVKTPAIMMALRRLHDRLEAQFETKLKFDRETEITTKSDLCEIVLKKTLRVDRIIQSRIIQSLELDVMNKGMFSIVSGIDQINIIASKRHKESILKKFRKDDVIVTIDDLAGITITISQKVFEKPGFFYLLTRALAWESISIVELISTMTELTFLVHDDDLMRSHAALRRTIQEHM
ncbi:hypothetical protein J4460_08120 [Candidatus Woesearchaeota archaeon]|nr:MAG: hypothetical protein QS99_C0012G0068 [archaeon GW2011_AR4]MBS3130605.1 hypothetical protein [Candidatus Woesearchaeota archaeon]HIH39059.1 hypothetical protein [Candidatus Woesearchaeota archaeon]HIH48265.1 hypothetical protein [Candidatus Woesearchaeota archaeon]HIJ03826.1 hypothetical protein [Candidatus Woesearchaeota archaeon]